MHNYLFIILTGSNLLLLTSCLIIHKQNTKDTEEICVENYFPSIKSNSLRPCYINNYRDRSIFVWFTIEQSLFNIFHAYRFILRSINEISLSTVNIHILTNFTQLTDLNNSLHILNLEPGQYEVCIDFQSHLTSFIYSPRNGCIFIRRNELASGAFKQNSTQLFIASVIGIILFLIFTIVGQLIKVQRKGNDEQSLDDIKVKSYENTQIQQVKSSDEVSKGSSKNQRNLIVRKLFRRHADQTESSRLQHWTLNRVFRHCMSLEKQQAKQAKEIKRKNKEISMMKKIKSQKAHVSSNETSNISDIYTIPMNKLSRKVSFYLTPIEEFEFI